MGNVKEKRKNEEKNWKNVYREFRGSSEGVPREFR
jgi:hypothetical protein